MVLKESTLTYREILELAKCELARRCCDADDTFSIYSRLVSDDKGYLSLLESARQSRSDLFCKFSYLHDLLSSMSDGS